MNLRPRERQPFSGFTKAEVRKMEKLLNESKEQSPDEDFYKNLARIFNRSSNRVGKPLLKWTEIKNWFSKNKTDRRSKDTKELPVELEAVFRNKSNENTEMHEGVKGQDVSNLEFEARSSVDGAWYDVDTFLSHRFLDSGKIEARVRYVGFGAEEDEWVNVRENVRLRSVALEHSECQKVKVGDLVVCFQEREDEARYFDAHVIDIQRRLHDIRGCRCLFLISYDHDNSQERVQLGRLCCRPERVTPVAN